MTAWAISALVAGIAAWGGSYLGQKGKNFATRGDIEKLTRLTEEVRADVSGKVWLEQERWKIKQEFYWDVVQKAVDLMTLCQFIARKIEVERSQKKDEASIANEIVSLMKGQFTPILTSMNKQAALAGIIVNESAGQEFDAFLKGAIATSSKSGQDEPAWFLHVADGAAQLRDKFRDIAKVDLEFSIKPAKNQS